MITLRDIDTDKLEKSCKRLGYTIMIVWGTAALASLAITVGLIYAAVHFIHKYW